MADADVVITGTVLTVAQTIDAAWQLFSDDIIGSLEVGKYADLVVLSADPRAVPPEQIADLDVCATYLAGRQVYPQ
jgi:predicted amidohydrolase YtcJ